MGHKEFNSVYNQNRKSIFFHIEGFKEGNKTKPSQTQHHKYCTIKLYNTSQFKLGMQSKTARYFSKRKKKGKKKRKKKKKTFLCNFLPKMAVIPALFFCFVFYYFK
uniref:Uncharacterized protein n=1 Tax=Pyxicephalus adspersus TaxID=30357 RepID=A0AAV3AXF3_PYXAD|nr:TPA: hypothetical protein GDO54_007803 [Pyxicephalus adspersus]